METDIWNKLPLAELPQGAALRQALLERLIKADGHINATERKLWDDTDRGLWSARQAKARIAEVWLWLGGHDEEPPNVGRYLDRETTTARLSVFETITTPPEFVAARTRLEATEGLVRAIPFPKLNGPLSEDARGALNAGLARKHNLVRALRECLRVTEDAFADRYVALKAGNWVQLHDGESGCMVGRRGLIAQFFLPSQAWPNPGEAHRGYALHIARFHRRDEPTPRLIGVPTYYWMCCAFDRHRAAWQALKQQNTPALFEVTGLAQQSIDAAAKAWLGRFAPGHRDVAWSTCSGQNVRAVAERDTSNLGETLLKYWRHIGGIQHRGAMPAELKSPSWPLQLAVALQALAPTLASLADLLAPDIPLAPGDRLHLKGARNATLVARDDRNLKVRTGHGTAVELRLFETFAELATGNERPDR
jgi:hypothetical protein